MKCKRCAKNPRLDQIGVNICAKCLLCAMADVLDESETPGIVKVLRAVSGNDILNEWVVHLAESLHYQVIGKYQQVKPETQPRHIEQLVYFIEGGNSIKIGVAEYPQNRLRILQNSSPLALKILKTCNGGREEERKLHARFAHLRQHGEWFKKSDELMDFIVRPNA